MVREYNLPNLGEEVEGGSVVRVLVSKGDVIEKEQPVLEVETDKAVIEVPAPESGVVREIFVKEGEKIRVGQKILTYDEGAAGPKKKDSAPKADSAREKPAAASAATEKKEKEIIREKAAAEERKISPGPAREEESWREMRGEEKKEVKKPEPERSSEEEEQAVPAAPSVRRFARELGIGVAEVPGSGPHGRVSMEDVMKYAYQVITGKPRQRPGASTEKSGIIEETPWGFIERKPMSGVRKKIAEHLSAAWTSSPRVTQFDKADITELERLREEWQKKAERSGTRLTVTAIAVKIIAGALKVFPQCNATLDLAKEEIIYKKYYNIGIAVDTPFGLLVPVIRDADRKNILEISTEIAELAEKARTRKIKPEEMHGGTFTVTNLGGIGGTGFTPIVNYPEVAILGIARSNVEAVWVNDKFEPRLMLPLSVAYDHRVIDGADGARFVRWIVQALEHPLLLALEG
ncbi:MAG: 2-oxo acid dehydrogenase subunit E2 [bacterium]